MPAAFFAPWLLAGTAKKIDAPFQNLPLSFEANRGQFDKRARFLVRGQDRSLFLTDYGMVVVLANGRASEPVQAVVYRQVLSNIASALTEIFSNPPIVHPKDLSAQDQAEYFMVVPQNGINYGYHLYFMQGADGVWRLFSL